MYQLCRLPEGTAVLTITNTIFRNWVLDSLKLYFSFVFRNFLVRINTVINSPGKWNVPIYVRFQSILDIAHICWKQTTCTSIILFVTINITKGNKSLLPKSISLNLGMVYTNCSYFYYVTYKCFLIKTCKKQLYGSCYERM